MDNLQFNWMPITAYVGITLVLVTILTIYSYSYADKKNRPTLFSIFCNLLNVAFCALVIYFVANTSMTLGWTLSIILTTCASACVTLNMSNQNK